MVDATTCTLYELFDARYSSSGSTAGSGAIWNLRSNALRPSTWTSADAAGLPILPGLLRVDEVLSGVVSHAIRFTAAQTDRSFVWPARHQAGGASDPNLPPMGARFRLKANFDISAFQPETQVILRAMQHYGLILADNGSNWYFGGASQDGWDNGVLDQLKSIPASAFDAVDESSLMIDPNSGQARSQSVPTIPVAPGGGYRMVASDGGIFSFGSARFFGSTGAMRLNQPVVGMAATSDGLGYWLVAADGGIFNFGDARFVGSTGALRLNRPIVGMAATPTGKGYWLVAADGGIFNFGDAAFLGSQGGARLNQPIVGMAATPSGRGYWLVAADGGIFRFGDAGFYGSGGSASLAAPVVGLSATPSGRGYRLAASDGQVLAFGDAAYAGGATALNHPVVGIETTPSGKGYRLVASDGGVFVFGDAAFLGSAGALPLARPVVGAA
jgi:ribosomal protein L24E